MAGKILNSAQINALDRQLSALFLKYILLFEYKLRTVISYHLLKLQYDGVEPFKACEISELINGKTMGQLSVFYSELSPSVKSKISKDFDYLNEATLRRTASVLTKVKNICTHGDSLCLYKSREAIFDTLLHEKLQIPKRNGQYICGKHDLFSVVILLKFVLPSSSFAEFFNELSDIITAFSEKENLAASQVLKAIHFPLNWELLTELPV